MTVFKIDKSITHHVPQWATLAGFVGIVAIIAYLISKSRAQPKSIGWRRVPQPLSLPIIKNLWLINLKEPVASVHELAKQYKDCFRISLPGASIVMINSQRLYESVCNTKRFHKEPVGALLEARLGGADGLLTAWTDEENYQIAHRLLAAPLSANGVQDYFDDICDMTRVLVDTWAHRGSETSFDPMTEFRKFSLDTAAHCLLDLQLRSMEQDVMHPFAPALTFFMAESGKRALRPRFVTSLLKGRDRRFWSSIKQIQGTAWEAIQKRETNGKRRNDVLDILMHGADPKTGKSLSRQSVMYNAATMLATAYDGPASLLSWITIMLAKHPECLRKLQEEIDANLGDQPVTKEAVKDLPYLTAVIRETLRLYPSSTAHNLKVREEVCADSEYSEGIGTEQFRVTRDDMIRINLIDIQRDPEVWGEDSSEFKPERMLEENFDKLPRNAWKPFGHGTRMCPGRFFGWQVAQIVIPTLVRDFDIALTDDRCRMHIGKMLTLIPLDCSMVAKPRGNLIV